MYLFFSEKIQLLFNVQGSWYSPSTLPTMVHYSSCTRIISQLLSSVQFISTTSLIDWSLTPTLAIFQLYRVVNKNMLTYTHRLYTTWRYDVQQQNVIDQN
jgi:membrane protein YdbS with pleckstrin-like domain